MYKVWDSDVVKELRHSICEGICGEQWSHLCEEKERHGTCNGYAWGMVAQKRRSIYPLIGGKHKKWFVSVSCNVDGKNHVRKFESCVGYNDKIDNDGTF